MLLVEGRDRVALCVDRAGGADIDLADASANVRAAVESATRNPNSRLIGYPEAAPIVDRGCPSMPYLLRPGVQHTDGFIWGFPPGLDVDSASAYLVFVFVLPESLVYELFRGNETVWGGRILYQEAFIVGDSRRVPASYGLYLSERELHDESILGRWIDRVLSVSPNGIK